MSRRTQAGSKLHHILSQGGPQMARVSWPDSPQNALTDSQVAVLLGALKAQEDEDGRRRQQQRQLVHSENERRRQWQRQDTRQGSANRRPVAMAIIGSAETESVSLHNVDGPWRDHATWGGSWKRAAKVRKQWQRHAGKDVDPRSHRTIRYTA